MCPRQRTGSLKAASEEGTAVSFNSVLGQLGPLPMGAPELPQGRGRYLGHLGPVSPLSAWHRAEDVDLLRWSCS